MIKVVIAIIWIISLLIAISLGGYIQRWLYRQDSMINGKKRSKHLPSN